MDIRSNEPYWLVKNSFVNSYPSLNQSLDTNILIVGGGITGALIAYRLLKTGRELVMLDRRDVCNGSTAASTAMLQYEIDVPLHLLIEKRGRDCAVSSYRNCEKAIFELRNIANSINSDCHFELKKSIYFTSRKKDIPFLKAEFQVRKKFGFDVRWMQAAEFEKIGMKALAGIESLSAAVIDPYKFTNDMLNYCVGRGMAIFDRTEVKKITRTKQGIEAYTADGFRIKAEDAVLCTGYESIKMTGKKIVDLKSTYALASEAFDTLPQPFGHSILWNTDSPYLYFRSSPDNRIIVGGGDVPFRNAKKRDALIECKRNFLLKQFQQIFPAIDFKPDYCWAGTFGETSDGLPYMGMQKPDSLQHFVLGFGGNGITYSVMAMDAITDSLQGKKHPFLQYYRFGR